MQECEARCTPEGRALGEAVGLRRREEERKKERKIERESNRVRERDRQTDRHADRQTDRTQVYKAGCRPEGRALCEAVGLWLLTKANALSFIA